MSQEKNQNTKYFIFAICITAFIFLTFLSLIFIKIKSSEVRHSIICTENGKVVFEAENQKRSFGFDGRTRQVHIYDNYSLSKTITFTDETSCEQTYTHARTNS